MELEKELEQFRQEAQRLKAGRRSGSLPFPEALRAFARLAFERSGPRTVVRTALAHSPLRLLTPRNHGHAAWAYTSTFGGGLVQVLHTTREWLSFLPALLGDDPWARRV